MWTDADLDDARYVSWTDWDTGQFLNVGTFEVRNSVYQGPYICTPMPPFGSVSQGVGYANPLHGVHVPGKRYTTHSSPRGFPAEQYGDKTVLHFYGNGDI